mgnify:CR=1 FL=1
MPSITNKICTKCNKVVKLPHDCQDKEKQTAAKMYNKTKRTNQEFYNSNAWRVKRVNILSRDCGLCQECLRNGRTTIGKIVHHIIEVNVSPQLKLVDDNLETICQTCHNQEHGE